MNFQHLNILVFYCLISCIYNNLQAQTQSSPIPTTKDSLTLYILNKKSINQTDWNYYLALKELGKQIMFEDRKSTADYLGEAYSIALKNEDTLEMASIAHLQGKNFRHWGHTYAAAEFFQHSYILTEKLGRREHAGYDLVCIGNLYHDLEKWEEAKMYFSRALDLFKSTNDLSGIAVTYNNLGLNAQETKQYKTALDYFSKGLNIRKKTNDSVLIAHSYYYLAVTYQKMKRAKEGIILAQKALQIFNDPRNREHKHFDLMSLPIAMCYYMGEMYYDLKDFKAAETVWKKSLTIGRKNPKLSKYFLMTYNAYAQFKNEQGQVDEAIKLLEEGINFATTLHFVEQQEALLLQLSDLLAQEGDYAKSLSYLREKYALTKRKMLGASNQMLNFHAMFETYEQKNALHKKELQLQRQQLKKQQQDRLIMFYLIALFILLLGLLLVLNLLRRINRVNKTIRQRNLAIEEQKDIIQSNAKELQELNETKDLLFSIIAHDLRTPFNSLTNFSRLMQTYIQNNQWQELKTSFKVLDESSQKAYWIFENLLGWIQSQTGKLTAKIVNIDIRPLLEESIGLLSSMQMMKRIKIEQSIMHPFVKADAYMLQTVFRNLLTNAIKFSEEKGTIQITTIITDQWVIIKLQDNGVGMDKDKIKNLFNMQNLKASNQSVSGLGLIICKKFIQNMNGIIKVDSQMNQGTVFTIHLPVGQTVKNSVKSTTVLNVETNKLGSDFSRLKEHQEILQKQLNGYLSQLNQHSVYEASFIKDIIHEINQTNSSDEIVALWLSYLNQAVYVGDASMFEDLIELLTSDE